jgi:hypothetical protein
MKIEQDVRHYAAKLNEKQEGLEEMAKKFREGGDSVCADSTARQLIPWIKCENRGSPLRNRSIDRWRSRNGSVADDLDGSAH